MNHQRYAILGVYVVQLNQVATDVYGRLERRQRILGSDLAVAAMGDHQNAIGVDQPGSRVRGLAIKSRCINPGRENERSATDRGKKP